MSMWDDYDYDPNDEDEDGLRLVTCKFCGVPGFNWHSTGVRWRLMDAKGNLHTCSAKATDDDFKDMTKCSQQ